MKKTVLILTYLLYSFICDGQEFLGIKVDGKKDAVISAFRSKGFKITGDSSKDIVTMSGSAGGRELEVYIICTPKSNLVWKFSVYMPKKETWLSLKNEYEEYLQILTEKYGEPKNKFNFFTNPYYEGDGYEIQALRLEKCKYSAFWNDDIGIYISISKYGQVKISYENSTNSKIDDKERSEINKNIF